MSRNIKPLALIAAVALCGGVLTAHAQSSSPSTVSDPNADNTAKNVGDGDPSSVTPLSQGNDDLDIQTTKEIRKRVLNIKDLSVNAQNIKIITNHGRVVLRGPVNSHEEFQRIADIASKVAGAKNVRNELEIKSNS